MNIYIVGGFVRDLILNRPPADRDWLVVGATEEEFLARFPRAKKIGNSFPVYLVDGEEYAFARLERKTGRGHKGFEFEFGPHVTLLDDLLRRDLTINAVAMDTRTGVIFMAPGAWEDFKARRLRHVSEHFVEDPLRVYRVARFAAQLPNFEVAPDTLELMFRLKGELITLPPERVFHELRKALSAPAPHRFFEVLRDAHVLDVHFPEVAALVGVPAGRGKHKKDAFEHTMRVLRGIETPILRWAALCHDLGKGTTPPQEWPKHHGHDTRGALLAERLADGLRVPADWKKAGIMAARLHMKTHRLLEMRPGKAVRLIHELFSRFPEGLKGFLALCRADGMTQRDSQEILARARKAFSVRLPEKYRGLGPKAGEILLQLRAEAWKTSP